MSTTSDNGDDFDLPAPEDAVSTGAAADSADWDERLKGLPRLLRYAKLIVDGADHIEERLIAEVDELCPQLPHNLVWASGRSLEAALTLAVELDRLAAAQNEPVLRSIADSIRLVSLPTPSTDEYFELHRRVGKALVQALQVGVGHADEELCGELEGFTYGWAALPACTHVLPEMVSAAANADRLGYRMAEHRIIATKAALHVSFRRQKKSAERSGVRGAERSCPGTVQGGCGDIPHHHLVVARLSDQEMKSQKLKDIIGPLKSVINTALPLVQTPVLHDRAMLCYSSSRTPLKWLTSR